MRRIWFSCLLLCICSFGWAQTPKITKVEPSLTFPFANVEITGSGFSTTPSQLQVWFGHVRGTILSSSESNIRVRVPAQARLSSVEVINLQSRRSAKSAVRYMPNFSGRQPFAGTFTATTFSNPDDIFDLCSCDFDGDGKPDIAGTKFRDGKQNIMLLINQSTISSNNSTIAFTQTTLPIAAPTFSITCGDLNGDGKPELLATRGGNISGNSVYVFANTSTPGSVSFAAAVTLDLVAGDFAKEVAVHDMNGDGRPDIVVTNGATNLFYIFENQLTGTAIAANQFTRHDISAGVSTLALEIADVSGDGWPDILATPNSNAQRVLILRNPGNGSLTFGAPTSISIGGSNNINDIAVADFNNDALIDFVVADRGSSKAFVYLNRTNLLFQSVNGTTGFASPTAWGVDVADMNGDGYADFVVGNRDFTNPQLNIYSNSTAATPGFTVTKLVTPKANWFLRAADFDGDSKPDIAITSTNNATSFSIDVIKNRNCHQPVILSDNPLTICSGQTITLNAVPIQGVTFAWSTGGTGPTTNIGFSNTGTITLTATGEGGTCVTSTTITVNPGAGGAAAKPVITGPAGACAGSTLTLSTAAVAGTPTYQWRGPDGFSIDNTSPSITINNVTASSAGNYAVRVKTGDCLSDTSDPFTVTVVEPAGFTITSTVGNTGVCVGQAVTLSVNPVSGYNYQWRRGGNNLSGQTNPSLSISSVSTADAGQYTVFISHQTISCSSETAPFALNVFAAPVAAFSTSPEQICVGTEVTFDASSSTVATGITANYAWEFGNSATGTGVTAKHTYQAAQSALTARLTVSYAGISSCSNVTTKTLSVNAATAPEISASPEVREICPNASETVVLAVTGAFSTFLWNVPSANTTSSISVKTPGTYSVKTTDANGCTGNAEYVLVRKEGCDVGSEITVNIAAPKLFTPNNDSANDFWVIEGINEYPDCTMSVFDGRGRRVFEAKGSVLANDPWDGLGSSGPVPDGTYYYVFGCPEAKPVTGSVLIVR
jgi:gliding motility-associated-like protein